MAINYITTIAIANYLNNMHMAMHTYVYGYILCCTIALYVCIMTHDYVIKVYMHMHA